MHPNISTNPIMEEKLPSKKIIEKVLVTLKYPTIIYVV